MSSLLALVPARYVVLLFVAAGFAFIFQAKRLGTSLMIAGAAAMLLPPIIRPFWSLVPGWLRPILLACSVLSAGRAMLNLAIGRGAADHAVGTLLADTIRFFFLLPFRLVRGLLGALFR